MDMDMDVFIQYLNDTNQSAIKGVKHFNLNLSDHKIRKLIKSNGYKYINQKWIKENSLHTSSHDFTSDEQEEDVDMTVLEEQQEESVHMTSRDVISQNFTLDEIDSHDMNSHHFTLDEQEEGVDMNLLKKQQENVIEDTLHTNSYPVNSPSFTKGEMTSRDIISRVFTLDEMTSLRAMINDWEQVKQPIQLATENDLISRIEAMPKDEKVRKTIVISKSTGEQLDEFCKVNRVQKSTILELAINDFILRY